MKLSEVYVYWSKWKTFSTCKKDKYKFWSKFNRIEIEKFVINDETTIVQLLLSVSSLFEDSKFFKIGGTVLHCENRRNASHVEMKELIKSYNYQNHAGYRCRRCFLARLSTRYMSICLITIFFYSTFFNNHSRSYLWNNFTASTPWKVFFNLFMQFKLSSPVLKMLQSAGSTLCK